MGWTDILPGQLPFPQGRWSRVSMGQRCSRIPRPENLLHADIFIPKFGVEGDELVHQVDAGLVAKDLQLHAS